VLEPVRVHLVVLDLQDVAGRPRAQHGSVGPWSAIRFECGAQLADLDPERIVPISTELIAPELVDEPVSRDRLVGVDEEQGEQCLLAGRSEREPFPVSPGLELPQDTELHGPSPPNGRAYEHLVATTIDAPATFCSLSAPQHEDEDSNGL
jgi:hypothetical protein